MWAPRSLTCFGTRRQRLARHQNTPANAACDNTARICEFRLYSIRNALSRRLSLTLCCRLLPRCFCTAFSPRWVTPTMRCVFPLWLYSWSAPFRRGGYCRSCQMLSSSYYVLQTMAVSRVTSVTWCAAEASPWNTCEEVLCRGRLANFYTVGVWIWRWLRCIGLRCDYKMISDLFWCSNFFWLFFYFFIEWFIIKSLMNLLTLCCIN